MKAYLFAILIAMPLMIGAMERDEEVIQNLSQRVAQLEAQVKLLSGNDDLTQIKDDLKLIQCYYEIDRLIRGSSHSDNIETLKHNVLNRVNSLVAKRIHSK